MPFLYDLGVRAYAAAVQAVAPFNPKARKWAAGRKALLSHIQERMQAERHPVAWFHCASLGEFEQGRPLMETFRKRFPDWKICLTFFSPSGYEVRQHYNGADYIFYLPVDTAGNARAFVEAVKPKLAVFVKYEFWHHYLQALHHAEVPVISVSAIFRPGQVFFKPYGGFYRDLLKQFAHFFVQNWASAYLLHSLHLTHVTVAGDTRFDRVSAIAKAAQQLPLAEAFARGSEVMVVGSSWPQDMAHLVPFMQAHPELRFIIAPHEMHEPELQELERQFYGQTVRYTKANSASAATSRVLLIDTIGLLSSQYRYGQYAYIGGAFGKGLHNILEAAAFGMPVFFGPKYDKFQEAQDLIARGGAFSITGTAQLEQAFAAVKYPSEAYRKAAEASRSYVAENTGATARIMEYLDQILP